MLRQRRRNSPADGPNIDNSVTNGRCAAVGIERIGARGVVQATRAVALAWAVGWVSVRNQGSG